MTNAASIENHPVYPFVRVGRVFDFEPSLASQRNHLFRPEDWEIEYEGICRSGQLFPSRDAAFEAVEEDLFQKWNWDLVARQINFAVRRGDIAFALTLAERWTNVEKIRRARAGYVANRSFRIPRHL